MIANTKIIQYISANSYIVIDHVSPENHKPDDMFVHLTHTEILSLALPAYLRLTGKIVDHENNFFLVIVQCTWSSPCAGGRGSALLSEGSWERPQAGPRWCLHRRMPVSVWSRVSLR